MNADTSEIAASVNEGRTVVNDSGRGGNDAWPAPASHGGHGRADASGVVSLAFDPAPAASVTLSSTAEAAVLDSPVAVGTVAAGGQAPARFRVRIGAAVACQASPLFSVGTG